MRGEVRGWGEVRVLVKGKDVNGEVSGGYEWRDEGMRRRV